MRQALLAVALLLCAVASPIKAAANKTEAVYVAAMSKMGSKPLVVRQNGQAYLLEVGSGCSSLFTQLGRSVVIEYSSIFGGVGSHLHIPDREQTCRVWSFDQFDIAR